MPDIAMSIDMSSSQIGAHVAVGLTILLSLTLIKSILKRMIGHEAKEKKIYRLHHAKLNIDVPPKTMWMNMGYWEVS